MLELVQIPQVTGSVPQDCPHSDANSKFQIVTRTSDCYKSGSHNPLLGFDHMLDSSQNLKKYLLTFISLLYNKEHKEYK